MKSHRISAVLRLLKKQGLRRFSDTLGDKGHITDFTGLKARYPKEFDHIRTKYDPDVSKIPKTEEDLRQHFKSPYLAGGPKGISVEDRSHLRSSVRVDSDKERHELLFAKVVNILLNMSDNQVGKVLHIYPESGCLHSDPNIAKNKKLEYNALSAFPAKAPITFPYMKRYQSLKYVDFAKETTIPFENKLFQFVVYLQPFVATAPQAADPMSGLTRLEELFRILDPEGGYVILGMREAEWDKHDLTIEMNKNPLFQCMSMQRLQFNPTRMNEYGAVIDDDDALCVIMEETEDTPMEHFMLCVLKKRPDVSLPSVEVKVMKHRRPLSETKFKGSSYKRY